MYPGPRRTSEIDGLNERQRLAVNLLARGKTLRDICRAINITERTLYGWRQKPEVQAAIFKAQQELINDTEAQGLNVIPNAISTLASIMNDPEARASDRVAASRALINGAHIFQERKLLERTIADLETQLFGAPRSPQTDFPTFPPLPDFIDPEDATEEPAFSRFSRDGEVIHPRQRRRRRRPPELPPSATDSIDISHS